MIDGGKRLLVGGKLFDAATGSAQGQVDENNGSEKSGMTVASAANIGAAASFSNGVGIWDIPQARMDGFIRLTARPLWVVLSPDGKTAYAYISSSGIHVLDATSGTETGTINATSPRALAVTPDGKTIVLRTSNSVDLLDAGTRQQAATVKLGMTSMMELMVSADGRLAFTSGSLLELPSLKVLGKVKEYDGMSRAAFSPDSAALAITQSDRLRIMKVADIAGGK